jgi:hypothetical protein
MQIFGIQTYEVHHQQSSTMNEVAAHRPVRTFFSHEFTQRCAILDAILHQERGKLAVAAYCFASSLSSFGESAATNTAKQLEEGADTMSFRLAFELFERLESEVRELTKVLKDQRRTA